MSERETFGSRFGMPATMSGVVFVLAIPTMINLEIFVPRDLTFGSGMQTLGSLLVVLTLGWCVARRDALKQLAGGEDAALPIRLLYGWLRWGVPLVLLAAG